VALFASQGSVRAEVVSVKVVAHATNPTTTARAAWNRAAAAVLQKRGAQKAKAEEKQAGK